MGYLKKIPRNVISAPSGSGVGVQMTGSASSSDSHKQFCNKYDGAVDTWSVRTIAPSPGRELVASCGTSGNGYVVSGINSSLATLADNDQYTVTTDSWLSRTNLPTIKVNNAAAGSNVIGSSFNVFGGGISVPQFFNHEFNVAGNSWATRVNLIYGRKMHTGAKNSLGKIYAMGGTDYYGGKRYNTEWVFDTWTQKTNLTSDMVNLTASSLGTSVYIGAALLFKEFDAPLNSWITKSASLTSHAKCYTFSLEVASEVYYCGLPTTPYNIVDRWKKATNVWDVRAPHAAYLAGSSASG